MILQSSQEKTVVVQTWGGGGGKQGAVWFMSDVKWRIG